MIQSFVFCATFQWGQGNSEKGTGQILIGDVVKSNFTTSPNILHSIVACSCDYVKLLLSCQVNELNSIS